MSEEEEEVKKEKEALDNLGVGSTFNILSESKDKKKKEPEEKKEFIGFK
jgi:hypothetical protein